MYTSKAIAAGMGALPIQAPPAFSVEKELTIKDVWGVFVRRKGIVLSTVLLFVGLAVVVCTLSTRRYEATGELQVQKESADALGLESMMGAAEGASDALDANITMQTQAQVLQSSSLALKVIKDLHLEQNQDFRPSFNPIGALLGAVLPAGRTDPSNVELENAPARRTRVLSTFAKSLKVKPVSGTRLIDITYLNPDPNVSAAVVNHLMQGLADYNFQTRYNATEQAAGWLGGQLSDLRKQSEALQSQVVHLQRDSGVFTLGETDTQGREQVYTPVLDRLQQATAQLTQAQSNRIMKGALYQIVKNGDPELISGLAGTGLMAAAPAGMSGSLGLIQTLRGQEATMQGQFNELSAKFGPAYPKLAEFRANLDGVEKSIRAEATRVAERAKNDFTMSQQIEDSARSVFASEKHQADALNDRAIKYQIVKQEAVESRALYSNLLTRLKEAGVLAGLRSSNITVVDTARAPSKPSKPNVMLFMAGSLIAGLFIGSCGAFLRDTMDNKIQNLPELEAYLGETPLGILPYHQPVRRIKEPVTNQITDERSGDEQVPGVAGSLTAALPALMLNAGSSAAFTVISQPRSPYTEAVRALRTSLLLSRGGAPPQVVLVTSSVPGEGKSMLSSNLAALLATQQGKKVLLVDGDLRRPVLHRRLNLEGSEGLSTILTADNIQSGAMSAAIAMPDVPGLDVLPAGPVPPYPSELLGSDQMREAIDCWRQHYDFIVIDAAPVLPVTDSVLLNTEADLTLVVARYRMTELQSLERSCRLLQTGGRKSKIGVVLNAVERSANTYYQYYGYNNSSYYGNEQHA